MFGNLRLWLGLAAIVIAALGGWTVRDWKADADLLAAHQHSDKVQEAMLATVGSAAATYEVFRATDEPLRSSSTNTIREVYKNAPPVDINCALLPDAARVLQGAVDAANAAARGELGRPVFTPARPADARSGTGDVGDFGGPVLPRLRWETLDDDRSLAQSR